jgi:alcohol dehydrogenase
VFGASSFPAPLTVPVVRAAPAPAEPERRYRPAVAALEPFRYRTPQQTTFFGDGAIARLPAVIAEHGWRRLFVIASVSAGRSEAHRMVTEQITAFDVVGEELGVRRHAPIVDTEALADRLRDDPPDALIAVGGGSAIDTAKAVAIVLGEGGRLVDSCTTYAPEDGIKEPALMAAKLPIIAVPTTMAGAEMSPGGGARDLTVPTKRVFWDPLACPRVVAYDPAALADVPDDVILTTSMNGLAHCAEGLYSRTRNPVSSVLAQRGAAAFAEGFAHLLDGRDRHAAVGQLQLAAALAGMVMVNSRIALHHAICHVIGGVTGTHHGVANSLLLPYSLAFNHPVTVDAQETLAACLRSGLPFLDDSLTLSAAIATVQQRLGLPRTLEEVGLPAETLPTIAERALRDRGLHFNPRAVDDPQPILEILQAAWCGDLEAFERRVEAGHP